MSDSTNSTGRTAKPKTDLSKHQLWTPVITALGTAALAAAAAFAGGYLSYVGKDRELDIRMVEIGLSILRGQTDDERAEPARQFAIEALKEYSGLNPDSIEWHRWMEVGTVPFDAIANSTTWPTVLGRMQRLMLLDKLQAAQTDEERAAIVATLRDMDAYPNSSPNMNILTSTPE